MIDECVMFLFQKWVSVLVEHFVEEETEFIFAAIFYLMLHILYAITVSALRLLLVHRSLFLFNRYVTFDLIRDDSFGHVPVVKLIKEILKHAKLLFIGDSAAY